MNITNCYYTGVYKSMTDDWGYTLGTTGVVIIISALGFGIQKLSRIERNVHEQMERVKAAIAARGRRVGDLLQLDAETNLQQGKEVLRNVRRLKYFMLGTAGVTIGLVTPMYCQLGCPAFDYWSEMGNQIRLWFLLPNKVSLLSEK